MTLRTGTFYLAGSRNFLFGRNTEGEVFDRSPENIDKQTIRAALPNGMQLVLLPKKTRNGVVYGDILGRFGTEKSLSGKTAIAEMTGSLLIYGTTSRTRQKIDDELTRLNSRLNVSGSAGWFGASFEAPSGNLEDLLRLLADVLRNPLLPGQGMETIRQQRFNQIESSRQDPQAAALKELFRVMSSYPRGDVRASKSFDESIEDLRAVNLADIRKFYSEFYGLSNGDLVLVGDFDAAQVQKLSGELFGNWTSSSPYVPVVQEHQQTSAVSKVIETPGKANAVFAAGEPIALNYKDPDYAAVRFAHFIFGGRGNNRIMNRLRGKEGWSYSGDCEISTGTKGNGGWFRVYAIAAPQNIAKVEAAVREELDKALKDGFTFAEVEAGKKAWVQQSLMDRSEDEMLRWKLADSFSLGLTMTGNVGAIDRKVASLTVGEVNAAFRRVISAASLSSVKAGDFKNAALGPRK